MKHLVLIVSLLATLASCARVGSPIGGAKDTIAPKVIGHSLDTSKVHVSTDLKELRIYFDEYITLKEPGKNLIISPNLKLKKIIPSSIGNKYIALQWEEPLKANTTYSFNFGNAIADLNEGNILPYYNFAFSTGEKLDELYISGDITSGMNVKKHQNSSSDTQSNFVIGLYQEQDSINYQQKPYYITKADETGYFELNYISPGTYRLLAFDDQNQNSMVDNGEEDLAFLKEPLQITESISGMKLYTFPSQKKVKYKDIKQITGGLALIFQGQPQHVELSSEHEKLKNYKITHTPKSDTAYIWFDAKALNFKNNENIKLRYRADAKAGETSIFHKTDDKTDLNLTNAVGAQIPPNRPLVIESNYPLEQIKPDQWQLKADSLTTQSFQAEIAKYNPYKIIISSTFEAGKKYTLTIPKATVHTFFKANEKNYQFNFDIDKPENYGSLILKIENAPQSHFWVQFIDNQGKIVLSQYTSHSEIKFTEIKPGTYHIRLLVDENNNGIWEKADFTTLRFAEKVHLFPKAIEIRALWENRETWDLSSNSTDIIYPEDNAQTLISPLPVNSMKNK